MNNSRLKQQIDFILEMDKLKSVLRMTQIIGTERNENSAEHSWQLALMVLVLSEYSKESIDLLQVFKMVLIHDIVEIDAGDTYCYDESGTVDQADRENAAADRLFGLLPVEQEMEFRLAWEDFEAGKTPEARFARSLDRLMPLLHNFHSEGRIWLEQGIKRDQVLNRIDPIQDGSNELWDYANFIVNQAFEKGYLKG